MYDNQKQEPEVDIVPPVFTRLVPFNVRPAHRRAASLTILRIAIVAVAVLGLIFLTTGCFRRTGARLRGKTNRRKLAGFPDGEGPSGNKGEDGNEPCQGKGTEGSAEEANQAPQGASEKQEKEGSSTDPPAGSADAATAPRKRTTKRKHIENPKSPTDAPGGETPAKQPVIATNVQPVSEGPLRPVGGADKAAVAMEKVDVLCEILSIAITRANELFDRGAADNRGVLWLVNLLEGETRRLLNVSRAFIQEGATRLTDEQIGSLLQHIDHGDTLVETARGLVSQHGIPSTSSTSDDEVQPTKHALLPVLVSIGTHRQALRSALDKYQSDMAPQQLSQLLNIYHQALDAVANAQAVLGTLNGPMQQAAQQLTQEQILELSELVETASQLLTAGQPAAAGPAAPYSRGAPGQDQPASSAGAEGAKQKANDYAKKLDMKLQRLKDAIVAVSTAYAGSLSAGAQVALESLKEQARKQMRRAENLIKSGMLSETAIAMLISDIADLEEAIGLGMVRLF